MLVTGGEARMLRGGHVDGFFSPRIGPKSRGGGKNVTTEDKAPERKVTYKGVVVDDMDAPLPGVSVTLPHAKGTGVTTDLNGRFEITVSEDVNNLSA